MARIHMFDVSIIIRSMPCTIFTRMHHSIQCQCPSTSLSMVTLVAVLNHHVKIVFSIHGVIWMAFWTVNSGESLVTVARGIVLEGIWCGQKAAYKFVPIENLKLQGSYKDNMSELRIRLNESIQYNETQSNFVVPFYAHYRFTSHFK